MIATYNTTNTTYGGIRWLILSTICACAVLSLSLNAGAQSTGTSSSQSASTTTNPTAYGNSSNIQNPNPGTAGAIRANYMKRYPFANAAMNSDTLQSMGTGSTLQRSAPASGPTPVMAYTPVIKFCNDNPMQGIAYMQPPGMIALDTPATNRDKELFGNTITTTGLPLTDTQFQIIDRENKQRFLELLYDPERWMWLMSNLGQIPAIDKGSHSLAGAAETNFQSAANNIAGGQDSTFSTAFSTNSTGGLVNIANEQSGFPVLDFNNKSLAQVVWMIQKMYSNVYLQMAVLFLLLGGILTQTVGLVKRGFLNWGSQDVTGPFDGILRSMIAVFLIPATQLFLSYSIDVGNSMANCVYPWINVSTITAWAAEQTYNPSPNNINNAILPSTSTGTSGVGTSLASFSSANSVGSGTGTSWGMSTLGANSIVGIINSIFGGGWNSYGVGGQGKAAQISETSTIQENQLWLSSTMQLAFNFAQYLFSWVVSRMTEFQVVLMAYLFLLGPLCACFFSYPTVSQSTFRGIFSNWMNAVVSVSLWRFQWCIILAIMTLHAQTCTNVNSQFEMMTAVCFLGLMMVVPFNPFTFQPGETATIALMKGSALAAQGMKAAGMSDQQINQALGPARTVSGTMMGAQMSQWQTQTPGIFGAGSPYGSGFGQTGIGTTGTQGTGTGTYAPAGYVGVPGGQTYNAPPLSSNSYQTSAATGVGMPFNVAQAATPSTAPPSTITQTPGSTQFASADGGIFPASPVSGPPMIPLAPPTSPGLLINTANAGTAAAGVAHMQQFAQNNPALMSLAGTLPPQAPPPITGTTSSASLQPPPTPMPGTVPPPPPSQPPDGPPRDHPYA